MHVLVPELAAGCTRTFVIDLDPDHNGTNDVADSANTMSSALEVLGLSLPYSSSTPATYDGASHESGLKGPQLTFTVSTCREAQRV
jgi:Dehydratase family